MEVLIGKSSINGPFSMAMLNSQRVEVNVHLICGLMIPKFCFLTIQYASTMTCQAFSHSKPGWWFEPL